MTTEATTNFPPFLKWDPSKDKENPEVLKIKVTTLEIFDTEFSTNTTAIVNGGEKTIPLWNFSTRNQTLLRKWKMYIANGKIKVGVEFSLTTYKQPHSINKEWTIRRWEILF